MNKIKLFSENYIKSISSKLEEINFKDLEIASHKILETIKKNKKIFVCGNGGSAAIANHYVCDYLKFLREKTNLKPQIISLSNSVETITAVSNDINYKYIFKYQIENLYKTGDLLIIISSSGNSENIKELVRYCRKKSIFIIGFCGFGGGYLKRFSRIKFHVNSNNYGIVEDLHHILMHMIMQSIINIYSKKQIKF